MIILGVKNVVLLILFVLILVEELVEVVNVFYLCDIDIIMELFECLGVKVECNGFVYVDAGLIN